MGQIHCGGRPYGSRLWGREPYDELGNLMDNPQVGELYKPPAGYQAMAQPGGPGTEVIPTQPPTIYTNPPYTAATNPTPYNERAAMFFPGCGHCIRSWEVQRDTVDCETKELLLCPLCHYIQAIYPLGVLLDTTITPVIYG